MIQDIYRVLRYFTLFLYSPSQDEIYCFLRKKTSKSQFQETLASLIAKKRVIQGKGAEFPDTNTTKYTLEGYGIFLKKNQRFSLYSQSKLKRISLYIKVLSVFPQVRFVGLSGTMSMMHTDRDDDIDLFVITSKNRLWTGRFLSNGAAFFLGLKRKRLVQQAKDKICLNLFFEESSLCVPRFKQNEYIAHEILQVKPLINKSQTYERFLQANKWVFKLFPNAQTVFKNYIKPIPKRIRYRKNSLGDVFEQFFKTIQLPRIMKHKTSEIVAEYQLWFFPDDFERKIIKYNKKA